ncbi:MAG: DarT ssDNA thymidine ADP-ribosyltransferase family protein [Elusimicrobiota bacterium]|nr:DarT ssDNA thymidine ADP-ribosyltransferase family protein [Elusimicrobiota bacterium]
MNPSAFLARYRPIAIYHFTDSRNIPSILKHGILSKIELGEQVVGVYGFGGNYLSQNLDSKKNLWDYVHLCFTENHPMAYRAQQDGRIDCLTYIKIKPEVLLLPGVMGCATVANKQSSEILPIEQVLDKINFDVIYVPRPDFSSTEYKIGARSEILVPKSIDIKNILNF